MIKLNKNLLEAFEYFTDFDDVYSTSPKKKTQLTEASGHELTNKKSKVWKYDDYDYLPDPSEIEAFLKRIMAVIAYIGYIDKDQEKAYKNMDLFRTGLKDITDFNSFIRPYKQGGAKDLIKLFNTAILTDFPNYFGDALKPFCEAIVNKIKNEALKAIGNEYTEEPIDILKKCFMEANKDYQSLDEEERDVFKEVKTKNAIKKLLVPSDETVEKEGEVSDPDEDTDSIIAQNNNRRERNETKKERNKYRDPKKRDHNKLKPSKVIKMTSEELDMYDYEPFEKRNLINLISFIEKSDPESLKAEYEISKEDSFEDAQKKTDNPAILYALYTNEMAKLGDEIRKKIAKGEIDENDLNALTPTQDAAAYPESIQIEDNFGQKPERFEDTSDTLGDESVGAFLQMYTAITKNLNKIKELDNKNGKLLKSRKKLIDDLQNESDDAKKKALKDSIDKLTNQISKIAAKLDDYTNSNIVAAKDKMKEYLRNHFRDLYKFTVGDSKSKKYTFEDFLNTKLANVKDTDYESFANDLKLSGKEFEAKWGSNLNGMSLRDVKKAIGEADTTIDNATEEDTFSDGGRVTRNELSYLPKEVTNAVSRDAHQKSDKSTQDTEVEVQHRAEPIIYKGVKPEELKTKLLNLINQGINNKIDNVTLDDATIKDLEGLKEKVSNVNLEDKETSDTTKVAQLQKLKDEIERKILKYKTELVGNPEHPSIYKSDSKDTHNYVNSPKKLDEALETHDNLNEKLFDEYGRLKPEVKNKIEEIVNEFIKELEKNNVQILIEDVLLLGSNASYNYTEDSDLDIHIIANTNPLSCPKEIYDALYSAYRSIFNDKYEISLFGIPVEIYVEVEGTPRQSNGVYSVSQDLWLKEPNRAEIPEIDMDAFNAEYEKYEDKCIELLNQYAQGELNDEVPVINLIEEIYNLRKDSIKDGEFAIGNLVFKELRNNKYLERLKDARVDLITKRLTIEEGIQRQRGVVIKECLTAKAPNCKVVMGRDNFFMISNINEENLSEITRRVNALPFVEGVKKTFTPEENNSTTYKILGRTCK